MRPLFVLFFLVVLAASCVSARGALDVAAADYAATLETSAPMASPEERACRVRTGRDHAMVGTDDDGVHVTLRPSATCLTPDAGADVVGGSVQYRLNSFGHILERRFTP